MALAALLVASCGRPDPGPGAGSDRSGSIGRPVASEDGGSARDPDDEYDRLSQEVVATDDPATALQLFALQYGPLPGVEQPTGDPGEAHTGTFAISAVFQVWDAMSAEQRAAVLERLDLPADYTPSAAHPLGDTTGGPGEDEIVVESASGGGGRRAATVRRDDVTGYGESLQAVSAAVRAHLGRLGRTVLVVPSSGDATFQGRPALADTLVLPDGSCRIRVYPRQFPAPRGPSVTLAHELVHCYQQVWRGGTMPRPLWWVQEGTAEWAGAVANAEAAGSADPDVAGNLANWTFTPFRPLFDRTYDAFGWFAFVEERAPGLWSRLRAVSTSADAPSAVTAALGGALTPQLTAEWSTSQAGYPSFGADWEVTGRGVPPLPRRSAITYRPLGNGGGTTVSSRPWANDRTPLRLRAEVTRFEVADGTVGVARLGGTDRPVAELAGRGWCTDPGGSCTCPEGTRRAGETLPRLEGSDLYLTASGGASAGRVSVTGRTLREECGEGAACPVGTWRQEVASPLLGAQLVEGGTGTILTVEADGRIVQDFSSYAPITARGDPGDGGSLGSGTTTVHIAPQGTITARIDVPPPGTTFTSAEVRDVDASGLGGTGYTEIGGVRVEFTVEELRSFVGGLMSAGAAWGTGGSAGPVRVTCPSPAELVLDAGSGVTQSYARVEG